MTNVNLHMTGRGRKLVKRLTTVDDILKEMLISLPRPHDPYQHTNV